MIQCAKNWKMGKALFFTAIIGENVKFFCLLHITHLPFWIIDAYHFPKKQDPACVTMLFGKKTCWLKRALENPEQTAGDHHLYNFKLFISCRCIFFCYMYFDALVSIFSLYSERSHKSMTILRICVVADSVCYFAIWFDLSISVSRSNHSRMSFSCNC